MGYTAVLVIPTFVNGTKHLGNHEVPGIPGLDRPIPTPLSGVGDSGRDAGDPPLRKSAKRRHARRRG
jgi:hypothetical protein